MTDTPIKGLFTQITGDVHLCFDGELPDVGDVVELVVADRSNGSVGLLLRRKQSVTPTTEDAIK